ncbi:hypothetical protein B0H13DRAFT_2130709 [Mycena leptocephala]|nr:hypothetical protein B0H13DRAFT_2130709 [Mycena leptocephala]
MRGVREGMLLLVCSGNGPRSQDLWVLANAPFTTSVAYASPIHCGVSTRLDALSAASAPPRPRISRLHPDDLVPFSRWDPVDHFDTYVVAIHMGTNMTENEAVARTAHTSVQRAFSKLQALSIVSTAYALPTFSSSAPNRFAVGYSGSPIIPRVWARSAGGLRSLQQTQRPSQCIPICGYVTLYGTAPHFVSS